jgi:GTP-binding protein
MPITLAIVGRPNVGKSTLFNRLAGKRLAIVDDAPGVTRDRREADGRLGDLDLRLIDTAGFEDVNDESLEARMRAQTEAAVRDADVIAFVIDARIGVTPLDERFADLLRRADKPVVLLANKAEGRTAEAGLYEAYALGLGEPVAISAEHGEGMGDLHAAIDAAFSAPEIAEADADRAVDAVRPIKLAVIGRPNAGKSTLINALLRQDRLLTGPEAGITRDAIAVDWSWRGRAIRLIDTAGMRRKAKVQAKLEQLSVFETIHAIKFSDVCVLVMDAREALERQDLVIADLVIREGRALVLALAKWDQIDDPVAYMREFKLKLDHALPQARGALAVATSAVAGVGLEALMRAVTEAHDDWNARIKTGDLNRWLQHTIARHPPPAVSGRRIKPRYITQIKARPPTFVMMCSRAEALPDSYKRYLINDLRKAFGMEGVPVRLHVRANRNPFAEGE